MRKRLELPLTDVLLSLAHHCNTTPHPPKFTPEETQAIIEIFMCLLSDRMAEIGYKESFTKEQMEDFSGKAGEELVKFLHTYAGINTKELYNEPPKPNNK